MRLNRSPHPILVAVALLAGWALTPSVVRAQEASTYKVILYLAEDGATKEATIQRLHEVWNESQGPEQLKRLLSAQSVKRLEDVTVLPNRDTPAMKIGGVTVRVRGAYKDPKHDSMFLRVEIDGGQEAFVKEMISKFDETILLAYPLAEGDRSVVALIVPTSAGN